MSNTLFDQAAFERALGMAALDELARAIASNEPNHVIDARVSDVLNGPGLRLVETHQFAGVPLIAKLVLAARDAPS